TAGSREVGNSDCDQRDPLLHAPRGYGFSVDLELLDESLGSEPPYRRRQVWEWTAGGASSYAEMTNLPSALRDRLEERVPFSSLELQQEARSRDGPVKALFRTTEGHPVEAVLTRYRDGRLSVVSPL